MSAAMNGIALHGGCSPTAAPSSSSPTTAAPAIRLSALMGQPVIYVMTHDFDRPRRGRPDAPAGRASRELRAIPNLNVFRPADAVETAEAWEIALSATTHADVLCLSRQALPTLRTEPRRRTSPRAAPMCCARPRASAT